jgi:prepilin-type processing-associated H-X9-DG protein
MVAKLGRVRESLGSSATRLSCDDEGVLYEAFSESGLAETGLFVLTQAAFLPKFMAAKQQALRARCLSNLRNLAMACMMYSLDHGVLPAKLSELYPNYAASLEVFACPAHGEKKVSKGRIDEESDYRLEIPGAKLGEVKEQARTIMISEKEPNHRGGRNAAYVDGHVESIPGAKTAPAEPLRAIRNLVPRIAM